MFISERFFCIENSEICLRISFRERHLENAIELMAKMFDLYEPAGEDEEGAFNVAVTEDMSRDDVLKRVLETIAKI